jgi:hypothetical protein
MITGSTITAGYHLHKHQFNHDQTTRTENSQCDQVCDAAA